MHFHSLFLEMNLTELGFSTTTKIKNTVQIQKAKPQVNGKRN